MDSHSNYSNNIHISKQRGKNTPQWKTQAIDFSQLKYYNFKLNITLDNPHVLAVLSLFSLPLWHIFLLYVPFFLFFPTSYLLPSLSLL